MGRIQVYRALPEGEPTAWEKAEMQSWLTALVQTSALEGDLAAAQAQLAAAQTQLTAERAAASTLQAQLSTAYTDYAALVDLFRSLESSYRSLEASHKELQESRAWALAVRLSNLRLRLAPDGSKRIRWLSRCAGALRFCKHKAARLLGRRPRPQVEPLPLAQTLSPAAEPPAVSQETEVAPLEQDGGCVICPPETAIEEARGPDRCGGRRAPSTRKFRVAFLGSAVQDLQTMRYRAQHVMEALALAQLESTYVTEEELPDRLSTLLAHDLIVLVRRQLNDRVREVIEAARRHDVPVVFDIDDYLFDHWVLPYVEALGPHSLPYMDNLSQCVDACDYFTGSTTCLVEQAATRNKDSFLIHNGLGQLQLQLSQEALQVRSARADDGIVRIGYFSGSKTHQADFRVVYPALLRLLAEEPNVHLVIAGDLELGAFPGLVEFADRVMRLPYSDWRRLPANIALVDINLIPLVLTPFNDGKSNLKYYEAGALEIPSIASPTEIHRESILHGHNGLLATTGQEWYDALKCLVSDPVRRARMGQNAYEHVLRYYCPAATAAEAVTAYREVLRLHRARASFAEDALSVVLLMPAVDGNPQLHALIERANELVEAGHSVTAWKPAGPPASSEALRQLLEERAGPPRFGIQLGGELPCADVLIAVDGGGLQLAREHTGRAHVTVFLQLDSGPPSTSVEDLPVVWGDGAELEGQLQQCVRQCPPAFPLPPAAPCPDALPLRGAA